MELALCPEWAVPLHSDDEGRAPEAVAAEGDGAQRFASFDAWYARAMAKHARRLAEARASVKTARALVAAQEARHAAALAAGRDAEPLESLTLVFEGREPPPPPPPPPTDGGSGGGHHRQPTARTPLPWSLGVYHHIGAHGGRPLYRYRRAGRYLAFVDGRWGLFEGDPTLDGAAATEAAAPAFVSGPEEAAARPDGVHIWYARPGLVRTMQEERGEVRDAEAHALARDVLVEREAGRLYPPAAAGHTGSSEELPAAVRYRGGWWRRVEGLAVEEDVMDRVEGVGEMADDERGVDDARWAAVDAAEARAAELQRAAAFCEGLHATMADGRTECAVCMAPLRGRAVTVLSCLHAFDDRCVRILGSMAAASSHAHGGGGATAATVACPICRRRTRRRDMATFLHRPSSLLSGAPPVAAAAGVLEADNDDAGMEVAAAPSSKLGAVCERILSILRGSGDDKVVVFLKWGYSLELLAACLDERGVPSLYLLGARHRHQQCHHAEQRSSSPQQQGSSSSSSSSHSGGCVALLSPLGPDARAVPEARALAAFNGHLKQAEEEEDGEEEEGEGRVVSVQELAAVRVLLLRLDEVGVGRFVTC